jgi:hypothetical protein
LHAGAVGRPGGGGDLDRGRGQLQVDHDAVQADRVTQRNEIRGSFRAHDARETGHRDRVALRKVVTA